MLAAIGPIWDGNEVWLIAAGGVLFMAFPNVYATAFSGFYLALVVVLWLLILRGVAIEFRSHQDHPLWRESGHYFLARVRAVPRSSSARRLATSFGACPSVKTACVGWPCSQTSCRAAIPASLIGTPAWSGFWRPEVFAGLVARPWAFAFVALSIAGAWGAIWFMRSGRDLAAFLSSSAFLFGMVAATLAGQYPFWLRSTDLSTASPL